jgi:glycerophosphoryl diester phosphodiesterase
LWIRRVRRDLDFSRPEIASLPRLNLRSSKCYCIITDKHLTVNMNKNSDLSWFSTGSIWQWLKKSQLRMSLLIVLVSVSFSILQSCTTPSRQSDIKIIAHRGGMAERPENTMSAFKKSVELGANMLEIDLRTSKDGQLFILHDKTLDRTTNGKGPATDLSMQELKQLDAGSWFDSAYSAERIPSFKEVLEWAKAEEITLLLDLKESGQEYAARVADDIRRHGSEDKIVVGVRSPDQAKLFRKLLPNSAQLGFIGSQDDIEVYAKAGVDVIRLWNHWLENDLMLANRVREAGVKLMINGTVGDEEEAKVLLSFSPDWILIDDPARLKKSLKLRSTNSE